MPSFLGIDTSNYTTSAALYNSGSGRMICEKLMLPVKKGEKGLRQSDAVFHHTVQLPRVISSLAEKADITDISAVGVSVRPRNSEGSYMPCFLCGEGLAESVSSVKNIPVYKTSHQAGHILAALFSANMLPLLNGSFVAFHVSGGTTDCLYCTPDRDNIISVKCLGSSLDLKAGQLIDRTAVMLGLVFPGGSELERLAAQSVSDIPGSKIKPVIKNGSCCLSGFENIFRKMYEENVPGCDIAAACQYAVAETIERMTECAAAEYGDIPVIYAGGVMSNSFIRSYISQRRKCFFAAPELSCDNGAGTALFAAIRYGGIQIPYVNNN